MPRDFLAPAIFEAAQSFLSVFQLRKTGPEVIELIEKAKSTLSDAGIDGAETKTKEIFMETMMFSGSKSFSHVLNIMERYF